MTRYEEGARGARRSVLRAALFLYNPAMRWRGSLLLLAFLGAGAFLWTRRADLDLFKRGGQDTGDPRAPGADIRDTGDGTDRHGGDADAAVGWDMPPPPSGEFVDIELIGRPASEYGPGTPGADGDATYRELLEEVAQEMGVSDVIYDPALSRAAREVAYQTGVAGRAPPEAALGFLLHSSGAPEYSAAQFFTHSTDEDMDLVRQTMARALDRRFASMGRGPLRVGVGEVATPDGEYTRHVSILTGRRAYQVDATPRWVALGAEWTLSGQLPAGYRDAKATVLYPDNRLQVLDIEQRGRDFMATVPAGQVPGTMYVSVDGTDERGPGKLMQLSVEVGASADSLPTSIRVFVPEVETEFATLEDAESYAFTLLVADRMRLGLPPLIPDPELTAVARAHSRDMRDNGFFAHLSPSTGLAGDRLEAAGYRATMHAENLAKNDTLGEAQAALMGSIGHRKNILDPKPTHAGVGLAEERTGDDRVWYVTQVFAKKVVPIDPARVQSELLERVNRARAERRLDTVEESERLSRVAAEHARAVARGELDGVAQSALSELSDMRLSMGATVHAIYDIERFEIPEDLLGAEITGVGVGVHQSATDSHGRIGVVFIFANGWDGD